jgi:hypothetical protein
MDSSPTGRWAAPKALTVEGQACAVNATVVTAGHPDRYVQNALNGATELLKCTV